MKFHDLRKSLDLRRSAVAALFVPLFTVSPAIAQPAPSTTSGGVSTPMVAPADSDALWRACTRQTDPLQRLACFDNWAAKREPGASGTAAVAGPAPLNPPAASTAAPAAVATGLPATPAQPAEVAGATTSGCRDRRYSPLSRFWELEQAADCGSFRLRGYRSTGVSIVTADSVNKQPTSSAPGRDAETAQDYQKTEGRIQLSARVKLAKNILTSPEGAGSDSLWVGYTQQSYWQVFNPDLSRPFRTTDYEPEAMYIYPADVQLLGPLRFRYGGLGISHQSNGRELPLSRSWNRAQLLAGFEIGNAVTIETRLWKRFAGTRSETPGDVQGDDNPGITSLVGRGEIATTWYADKANTFALTLRHGLKSGSKGSARVEYYRALGTGAAFGNLNDLRLHASFFSGYGDSLIDFNRKRNVFAVGLSLVDW